MSEVKSKRLNIYIDQTAAETALEKLNVKATAYNKIIGEGKKKQEELKNEIVAALTAAAKVDGLKVNYANLAKSIDDAKNEQKKLRTEIEAGKASGKNVDDLRDKQRQLRVSVAESEKQFRALKREIADSEAAGRSVSKLKQNFTQLGIELTSAAKKLEVVDAEQRKISQQIDSKIGPSLKQQKNLVAQLNAELHRLPVGTAEFGEKLQQLRQAEPVLAAIKERIKGVEDAQNNMLKGSSVLTRAGVFIAGFAANVAAQAMSAVKQAITDTFQLTSQFETSIANLSAITGAAGADLDFLKASAIDLSKKGATSAQEYVDAFKLIASAKPELLNAKDDLVAVAQAANLLANASGLDLPTAATKLTDALNQFGAPASDAAKYVDALAAAAKYGSAEVPELTDAIIKFGSIAKSANVDIYESSAAVELLGEHALKGADAGTALRNVLIRLSAVEVLPKEALASLKAAGVNTDILKDKSLSLEKRLAELSKIKDNDNAITRVFNAENLNAGQIILQNLPRYAQLAAQIKEQGVAAQQAAVNTSTLANRWEQFKNILASRVLNGSNDFLKSLVERITTLVEPTKTATEQFKELSSSVNNLEKNVIPLANRYDELKGKTNLSNAEQAEMKSIVGQIASIMPGAVSAQDQYGAAIAINTGRVREFVQAEKARLTVVNSKAIDEYSKKVNAAQAAIDALAARQKERLSSGTFTVAETTTGFEKGSARTDYRKANQAEIADFDAKYQKLKTLKQGSEEELKRLSGDALQAQLDAQADAAKKADAERKKLQDGVKDDDNKKNTETTTKLKNQLNERTRLVKEYNDFVKGLNENINDLLTPDASRKMIEIFKEAQKETEKLNDLKAKGAINETQRQETLLVINKKRQEAIHALLVEEEKSYKTTIVNNSTIDPSGLPKALQNTVQNQKVEIKVPVEFLPQILPEDEKVVAEALQKTLKKLQDENKAGFQLKTLTAKNPGDKRKAELASLENDYADTFKNIETQRAQIVAGTRKQVDNVLLVQEQEYLQKRKDINKAALDEILAGISTALDFAAQVVNVLGKFNDAKEKRENAALQRELKNNDARKEGIRKLEAGKVISAQEARRQIRDIEIQDDARRQALEKKQFERRKRFQIAEALISGAQAVVRTIAIYGPPIPTSPKGIESIIGLALDAALTAASIIAIASQKFATGGKVTPEELRNGRINVTANIPTQPNGDNVFATVKTGEVILNEDQQRKLGGHKVFKAIGVPGFAGGGAVQPFWKTRPYQRLDVPAITRSMQIVKFAEGGRVGSAANISSPATDGAVLELLKQSQEILHQSQKVNFALLQSTSDLNNHLAEGIRADVLLGDIHRQQKQLDRIRADAGLR